MPTMWANLALFGLVFLFFGIHAFISNTTGLRFVIPIILKDKAARFAGGSFLIAGVINLLSFGTLLITQSTENREVPSVLIFALTAFVVIFGFVIAIAIQVGRDMDRRKRKSKED